MDAVLLVLTMVCGTPVYGVFTFPKDGAQQTLFGPITVDERKFWADLAVELEANGVRVIRVKGEDQVPGLRCPVST